jgi:predicted nucleic acid-binding protein
VSTVRGQGHTSTIIDLKRGPRNAAARRAYAGVRALRQAGETLATSRLNLAELYVGLAMSDRPEREREQIDTVLAVVAVLEFDDRAARAYAAIMALLRRIGKTVGDMDALIAAVALANGQRLMTRNVRHFAGIPGLGVIGY